MYKNRIIFSLMILLLITGCNSTKDTEKNQNTQNKIVKNQSTINKITKNDILKKEKTITKPVKKLNLQSTNRTFNDSIKDTKNSMDLKSYLLNQSDIFLKGKVTENLALNMELEKTTKESTLKIGDLYWNSSLLKNDRPLTRYRGKYQYDNVKKWIKVEALVYSNGYISIIELNDKNQINGSFGGFINGQCIQGIWTNKNGVAKYPFYLIQDGLQFDDKKLKFSRNRMGLYNLNNSNKNYSANLDIFMEGNDKFKFEIKGNLNGNTGQVDGVAIYTNSSRGRAVYINKSNNLRITFIFKGDKIEVSGNKIIEEYGGENVSLTGTFIK